MTDFTWMPRIDAQRCNGCGACIAACPTGALDWSAGKATLTRPEKCIYCANCEDICPTAAIELPYLIRKCAAPSVPADYAEQQGDQLFERSNHV